MIYVIAHLTIGIVLLGTVLIQHYFEKRRSKATNDLADLLAPVQNEPSLVKRIWKKTIRPVLGGILVVIAWPLVLIFVAIKLFAPSKKKKTSEPIAFTVSTDDLKKQLSIAEIEERGLSVCVRSDISEDGMPCHLVPDVLLIDTTGELKNFYPHATIIFIGKSLCSTGGQNIIEPALYGKSVIVGPHMGNFPVVFEEFKKADAVLQVANATSLESTIADLLDDETLRSRMGDNAASLVREKSGAVHETVSLIERSLFGKG